MQLCWNWKKKWWNLTLQNFCIFFFLPKSINKKEFFFTFSFLQAFCLENCGEIERSDFIAYLPSFKVCWLNFFCSRFTRLESLSKCVKNEKLNWKLMWSGNVFHENLFSSPLSLSFFWIVYLTLNSGAWIFNEEIPANSLHTHTLTCVRAFNDSLSRFILYSALDLFRYLNEFDFLLWKIKIK